MNLKPFVLPALTVAFAVFGWIVGWSIYDSDAFPMYKPATFQLIMVAAVGVIMVAGFTFSYHRYQKNQNNIEQDILDDPTEANLPTQKKKLTPEEKELLATQKEINETFGQMTAGVELNGKDQVVPEPTTAKAKVDKESLDDQFEKSRIALGIAVNKNLVRQLDTDKLLATPTKNLDKLGYGKNIEIKIERNGKQTTLPIAQNDQEIPDELLRGVES
jgi:hypothetical protein